LLIVCFREAKHCGENLLGAIPDQATTYPPMRQNCHEVIVSFL
jgi:hypothetical protein